MPFDKWMEVKPAEGRTYNKDPKQAKKDWEDGLTFVIVGGPSDDRHTSIADSAVKMAVGIDRVSITDENGFYLTTLKL